MLGKNAARRYGFDFDALAPIAAVVGPSVDEVRRPLTEWPELPGVAFTPEDPLEALLA